MIKNLKIRIISFSYKYGVPNDENVNLGGYVFDCRLLPNPGRLPEYSELTGKDVPVVNFFEAQPEVSEFLNNVRNLVLQAANAYRKIEFDRLSVCFGCTGGQHRSVYISEKIAGLLKEHNYFEVQLVHRGLELKI